MKGHSPIQAVIFDFDGVIADTEPLHHRAFCRVVEPDGLTCSWDEYLRDYIGYDDRDLFRVAYQKIERSLSASALQELIQAKADVFVTLTREGVDAYEGVPELIRDVRARYPIALCSGALRSDIEPILAQLGLASAFGVWVTAEDVPVSKPDPACYRLAVEQLAASLHMDLPAAGCVAIEDTPAGIEAAKGAGLRVWAVTHTNERETLARADAVFDAVHLIRDRLGVGADA